ncbi:hypothetical protein H6503_02960 [Candidatus Woesearchaeota archaeon]|nr:hypothetical protein [Candidatus Woesearchaeota archaeon]
MQRLFDKISERLVMQKAKSPESLKGINAPTPIPFSQSNFNSYDKIPGKIAFIDGGSIEIAGNNSFTFQLLRVCWVVYDGNKRIGQNISECFVFIDKNDAEVYDKENDNPIEIISFKEDDPEAVIGNIRRLMELRQIEKISRLYDDCLIVIDGTIDAENSHEKDILHNLPSSIMIAGLSKTSSAKTDSGSNLVGYVNAISPQGRWFYHPLWQDCNKFVAKLHEKSEYAFLLDTNSADNFKEIVERLSSNSMDPTFLGYPYGLIEADRKARCSKEEQSYLQTRFFRSDARLRKLINTSNAHDILDSIK